MGMSIDIHIYDYFGLVQSIDDAVREDLTDYPEGRTLNDFVEKILPKFGFRSGDKFIVLWNDYYSDSGYNAASEMLRAVELYFGIDDVWFGGYGTHRHANAEEVLEDLGIEPIVFDSAQQSMVD